MYGDFCFMSLVFCKTFGQVWQMHPFLLLLSSLLLSAVERRQSRSAMLLFVCRLLFAAVAHIYKCTALVTAGLLL
jgi:hypothetical protein